MPAFLREKQVAVTRGERLFIKNTGPSKPVMVCTGADSCSLPVRETPVQRGQALVKSGPNSEALKVA